MGWLAVMVLGFVCEIAGVAIAAWGLWQTWDQNAEGQSFWPPRVHQAIGWVRRHVLRRPFVPATGSFNGTLPALQGEASGVASQALMENMSLEEKIEAVQENALKALRMASEAGAAVRREARKRERHIGRLTDQIERAERAAAMFARTLTVDGVPKAVGGLVLAALGLVLQGVASVATF